MGIHPLFSLFFSCIFRVFFLYGAQQNYSLQ
nr:MAG TPA: hypothetical protein [Caudoviricetes sp.]